MDTLQGGFYVNRGKLEFKTRHEEINDSDISDADEAPQQKKGTVSVLSDSTVPSFLQLFYKTVILLYTSKSSKLLRGFKASVQPHVNGNYGAFLH